MSSAEAPTDGGPAEPASATCVGCKAAITTTYFKLKGKTVCPGCRVKLPAALRKGSETRFLRGAGFGLLASVVAGVGLYILRNKFGVESMIVTIGAGFVIGAAVHIGARMRGGLGYQILAVVLTYLTMAGSWAPAVLEDASKIHAEGLSGMLLAFLAFGYSLTLPFRLDFMSMAFVGGALYAAWRSNQDKAFVITGPFQLAAKPSSTASRCV